MDIRVVYKGEGGFADCPTYREGKHGTVTSECLSDGDDALVWVQFDDERKYLCYVHNLMEE